MKLHLVYYWNGLEYEDDDKRLVGIFSTSAKAESFAGRLNDLLNQYRNAKESNELRSIEEKFNDLTGECWFDSNQKAKFSCGFVMPLDPGEKRGKK